MTTSGTSVAMSFDRRPYLATVAPEDTMAQAKETLSAPRYTPTGDLGPHADDVHAVIHGFTDAALLTPDAAMDAMDSEARRSQTAAAW